MRLSSRSWAQPLLLSFCGRCQHGSVCLQVSSPRRQSDGWTVPRTRTFPWGCVLSMYSHSLKGGYDTRKYLVLGGKGSYRQHSTFLSRMYYGGEPGWLRQSSNCLVLAQVMISAPARIRAEHRVCFRLSLPLSFAPLTCVHSLSNKQANNRMYYGTDKYLK